MARARIASSLVALWVCQATAGTSWAQSQKPPNLRLSGAFCGTAYFGSTPQFSWPADNAEIYLMPAEAEALVLVDRQQLTQAEAEFCEAVRVGGKHEVPYWQLTTFLVDHGRAGDADSALNQAQRNGISSAGVNASRGLLAFQNHQWKEAVK